MLLPSLLTLLAGAPVAATPAAAVPYIARAWGTGDGLPQNSVTAIVQTQDGYLWLGTFGGLVRFDGQAFTVFDPGNTPGLASARIVTLREDRKGALWIGTESGLTKYEHGRFTTYTTRDGLPHYEILSLLDDRRGRLWVCTVGGLARFDGRAFERLSLGDLSPSCLHLLELPGGDVLAATLTGVARFHDADRAVVVSREPANTLFLDSKGRVWLAGWRLERWNGPADSTQGAFVDAGPLDSVAARGGLIALAEDRDGSILVGTSEGGVYRWRDGEAVAHLDAEGLASRAVRSVAVDRDGNTWIGTDVKGLFRLKPRRAFGYPIPASLGGPSIGPIVADGADGLFVGATCGGLLHFRAGAFAPVSGLAPESRCVWALLRDPDGTLWIGSMGGGVDRYAGGRFTHYSVANGLPSTLVSTIARGRDGTLWVGTDGGLSRFDNGTFTSVARREGLAQRVLTVVDDSRGALWIGTVAGLYRLAGGQLTHYSAAEGLSNDHVRAIHEDADGVVWIGTYGGGLNRFKEGRFTTYGLKQGLPDVAVSRILEDPLGNFWMSGNKGVFRVARSQLNDLAEGLISYVTAVSYGTADGMIVDETNGGSPAGWRTQDGRFWFPTIDGLVEIDPSTKKATPPPVQVERTAVNGETVDAAVLPSLGPGNVDVEFHFTAIDLGAAEKTRFRYRLENYDPRWIDAGTRRVAYYTKLPPGSYHFMVMATDSDGAWSTAPARIAVGVIPLWWQRPEASVAAMFLLVAVTGFGVRHVSLRRTRARLAELEREQTLERERTRIARDLHDDLGARLSHIAIMADAGAVSERDARIAREARDAVQTMDELVWAVNARNDTVEGFAYFVAQFAEEHVVQAGLRCRLLLPPDLPARAIRADVRRHLYLAVKEAITNALKHAQASEIRLSLRIDGSSLVVEVADDGCGLPARIDPTGNGLRNLRERMEAAGGTLAVASTPGQGTRLTFTTPI
jgi:ligand-binding sensor domain-containing protein/signal transduction histidine kinase